MTYTEGLAALDDLREFFDGGVVELQKHSALPACLHLLGTLKLTHQLKLHLLITEDVLKQQAGSGAAPIDMFRQDLPPWAQPSVPTNAELGVKEKLLPDARDPQSIWTVVGRVLERSVVHDGDMVWLETTGGLRSITTGLQLAAVLLVSLRPQVRVVAATYAEVPPGTGRGTIYNLLSFFQVASQAPAVAALRYRIDPRPLVAYLTAHFTTESSLRLAEGLRPVSDAIDMGWPGTLADALGVLEPILDAPASDGRDHLWTITADLLRPLISSRPRTSTGEVDEASLRYELELIDRLVQADRHADALRLLRETLVTLMALALHRSAGKSVPLLAAHTRPARLEAERAWFRDPTVWGVRWKAVRDVRNAISHAGATDKPITADNVREIVSQEWVVELSAKLESKDWWQHLTRVRTAVSAMWLVDNTCGSGMPPPTPYGSRTELSPLEEGAKVSPGWAEKTFKKQCKIGVPVRVWLTVHPVRAAGLAAECHEFGIPVYSWDGVHAVVFPSPYK
ncbi:MAG: TM1812 family CRISPR-associated protein [Myxococcota bacterium]